MSRRERRAEHKAAAAARQAELHQALDEPIGGIGDWARNSGDQRVMQCALESALHGAAEASEIPPSVLAAFLADVHRRLTEGEP